MKKLYFLAVSLLLGAGAIAQTNLSFESWNAGNPVDWTTSNGFASVGTLSGTPVTEMTDTPTDGNSYYRGETVELSGSTNPQVPDGNYGGFGNLTYASTDVYSSMDVDVKYNVQGSDEAAVAIFGADAGGNTVYQGIEFFTGSQGTFQTVNIPISAFSANPVVEWTILVSSSAASILQNQPAAVVGSVLDVDNIVLNSSNPAPNVSNVVASDISDNCNGTDLEVTFDVPADETNVANYYLLVTAPGISPGQLTDPLAVFSAAGVAITPNGSNQSHTFSAADLYYFVDNGSLSGAAIAPDIDLIVHVYVEGANGFDDVFNVSNTVQLDCPSASLLENEIESVNVYPNPATDKVNFDFGNNTVESLTITDMNGRVVESVQGENTFVTIDLNNLENGVYFYNAVDNAGNVISTNKFVVNK